MKDLHIICGKCGCDEMLSYEINAAANCDDDGNEYAGVSIFCENCTTVTGLREVLEDKGERIYKP